MSVIDKLAWVRIEQNAVLVALSRNRDTYYLPGGKREAGERDEEALLREIKEELTVDLLAETVQLLGEFVAPAHGQAAGTTVRMRCFTAEYHGQLLPAAEIEGIAWLHYADRESASDATQQVMEHLLKIGFLTA